MLYLIYIYMEGRRNAEILLERLCDVIRREEAGRLLYYWYEYYELWIGLKVRGYLSWNEIGFKTITIIKKSYEYLHIITFKIGTSYI